MKVWRDADEKQFGFLAPPVFLSDQEIKHILDYFALLVSIERVVALITLNPRLEGHHEALHNVLCELRDEFAVMRAKKKEELRVKRAEKAAAKKLAANATAEVDSDDEEDSDSGSDINPMQPEQSGIRWRLNLRFVQVHR